MAETPTKPTRRVLVDVPVNTPSRLHGSNDFSGKSSLGRQIVSDATNPHAGQKRGILEVDEPELPPNQHRLFASRQDMPLGATMYMDEVRDSWHHGLRTILISDHRNQIRHVHHLHR